MTRGNTVAFLDSVRRSSRVAAEVDSPFVVVLAGDTIPDKPRSTQRRAIVDGLRQAAPLAEASGVTLLLENLNSRVDHGGHYLDSATEALDIIDEDRHPSVRKLYDLYHSVATGEPAPGGGAGRAARSRRPRSDRRRARPPEPGSRMIDWPGVIGWLAVSGYRHRVGLEHIPTVDTLQSVAYIRGLFGG